MNLNALASDFQLRAAASVKAPDVTTVSDAVYLTDPSGNRLTDPSGNYLIGYALVTTTPLLLSAGASDFGLNAE